MTNATTNTQKFADFVHSALHLGVNLATAAFERRDIGFFEAAIVEQDRLAKLAKYNVTNRPGYDEWVVGALKADSESFIHAYDTSGEIARLNKILFGEFGRDYYEQYVVPAFDTTHEALEAHFNSQVTALQAMVDMLKNDALTKEDDKIMNDIHQHLNKMIDESTPDELVGVIKK